MTCEDDDPVGLPLPEGLDLATLEFTVIEWRVLISKEPTIRSHLTSNFKATLHEDSVPGHATHWVSRFNEQLSEVGIFTMEHGPIGDLPRWATGTLKSERGRAYCYLFNFPKYDAQFLSIMGNVSNRRGAVKLETVVTPLPAHHQEVGLAITQYDFNILKPLYQL